MAERPSRGYFLAGDPLRAIGALAVVIVHCAWGAQMQMWNAGRGTIRHLELPVVRLAESGTVGVFLFFALSGYLLGRPFVAAFVEGSPSPRVPQYLRNRALRILPGLVALLLLTFLLFGSSGTGLPRLLAVPLLAQVYVPSAFARSMAHAWTIDDEAAFYLLLPVCFWVLRRRWTDSDSMVRRRVVLVGCLATAVASIVCASLEPTSQQNDRAHWLPMIACAFTPGIALAALSPSLHSWSERRGPTARRTAKWLALAALPLLGAYAVTAPHPILWLQFLLGTLGSGLLLGGALLRQLTDGRCWRIIDNRPLQWIGRRSYSLYLFHLPILQLLVVNVNQGAGFIAFLRYLVLLSVVMVPVSWLGYRFIERPFLRSRRDWQTVSGRRALRNRELPRKAEPQPSR